MSTLVELGPISDEELTVQALAADPDQPLDPDTVAFAGTESPFGSLLPDWYMPSPVAGSHKPWHRVLVVATIAGFVVINAFGFCITYGLLVQA